MQSEEKFQVYSQVIRGRRMYIAGRRKNTNEPPSGENMDWRGGYERSESVAQNRCDLLNGQALFEKRWGIA